MAPSSNRQERARGIAGHRVRVQDQNSFANPARIPPKKETLSHSAMGICFTSSAAGRM